MVIRTATSLDIATLLPLYEWQRAQRLFGRDLVEPVGEVTSPALGFWRVLKRQQTDSTE